MASDDDYSVIRIFPDYADSVIWFTGGLVAYEDSHVTDALRQDMEAWDARYYEYLGDDFDWRSREDRVDHVAEGRRLAERMSSEVGDGFEVEYFDEDDRRVRVRSDRPATNEAAARAFTAAGAACKAFHERIEREAAAGARFGWFARRPKSEPRHR